MKVFVTGGAGYVGSVAVETLLDKGHAVVVFDNLERGHRQAIDRRASFVRGDIRDVESICRAVKKARPDAVMHFAAYALVGESMEHPEMYWRNNLTGGINVSEAMIRSGVGKIVLSSTCATYGEPRRVPMLETDPQDPTNPYGASKLLLEKVLAWNERTKGVKAVFLRYFNACGATELHGEDHDPESHLIPNVLKVALGQKKKVIIHGDDYETPDGTCIRDYIHVLDLAQAHILALKSDFSGGINLGTGDGYSVKQVIDAARNITGRKIPVEIGKRRPGDPARLVACSSKAKKVLGWKPAVPALETIIETAWKWHLAHPNGYAGPGKTAR
jgi:UDP-glucose 4-epimerase